MKRLTSNNPFEMNMTELALNQAFVEKSWAWYTKAPGDYCSVSRAAELSTISASSLSSIQPSP